MNQLERIHSFFLKKDFYLFMKEPSLLWNVVVMGLCSVFGLPQKSFCLRLAFLQLRSCSLSGCYKCDNKLRYMPTYFSVVFFVEGVVQDKLKFKRGELKLDRGYLEVM